MPEEPDLAQARIDDIRADRIADRLAPVVASLGRLGYMVVRDEGKGVVADWDAVIYQSRRDADVEVLEAQRREPLYDWYLAEVRRAEAGD